MTARRKRIGARLCAARNAAGLTQGQVARLLGLHRPAISEIERGGRRVAADELAKLADIYGVGTDWIISKAGDDIQADDRILLAARQLSRMKDEDLDRLMKLISMLRKLGEGK